VAKLRVNRLHNQFAFTIEDEHRRVLGASMHPAIAFAMLRAARDEHLGRRVELRGVVGDLT
jgi:hypothetical protein